MELNGNLERTSLLRISKSEYDPACLGEKTKPTSPPLIDKDGENLRKEI